jgi:hypothetical protein
LLQDGDFCLNAAIVPMNELLIKTMKSIFSILYYLVDNFAEIPEKSGFSPDYLEKSGKNTDK